MAQGFGEVPIALTRQRKTMPLPPAMCVCRAGHWSSQESGFSKRIQPQAWMPPTGALLLFLVEQADQFLIELDGTLHISLNHRSLLGI